MAAIPVFARVQASQKRRFALRWHAKTAILMKTVVAVPFVSKEDAYYQNNAPLTPTAMVRKRPPIATEISFHPEANQSARNRLECV
jgi:hypothetical protein